MRIGRHVLRAAILIFAAVAASSARAQSTAPPSDYDPSFNYDCDRACLNGYMDQYLTALIAHDPSHLALNRDVKYTENGQVLKIGDGFWGTASGVSNYRIYAADPQAGQVLFIGLLQENGGPVIFCARLKIEMHQIAEIENVVARKEAGSIARPENLVTPNPLFAESVAPAERRSRANMIAIANSYFNAIEKGHGSFVPFDANCNRIESGIQTTNNPPQNSPQGSTSVLGLGCADQIKTRNFQPDTLIRDRRFLVVDEERGLVFVSTFFDHDATLRSYTLADGRAVKQSRTGPWTWEIAELFKIQDGKIMRIEALVNTGLYGMKSGW
jgi:hypothetical protein